MVIPQLAQSAVQLRAAEVCVFLLSVFFLSNISATCRYFNYVRIIILMNLLIVFVKRSTSKCFVQAAVQSYCLQGSFILKVCN